MTAAAMALVEVTANDTSSDAAPEDDDLVSAEDTSPWRWSRRIASSPHHRLVPHAIYPIWRIGDMELSRPIVVTVEHGQGEVVISSASLRVWGVGDEIYAALNDFQQTFCDVLESYEQTPQDGLTVDAQQYLEQLRSHLPRAYSVSELR